MAKYLDSTGVTSLISAIKNDGAKKITLGGYKKADASATLATTDTLNVALGKLEKNIEVSSSTSATNLATLKSELENKISSDIAAAVAGVFDFQGSIGTTANGATITALPAEHTQGWAYKVVTAGEYAGQSCQVGDLIVCVASGTTANNSHWTVVQGNGQVVNKNATLTPGTAVAIATVDGVDIKVTAPSLNTILPDKGSATKGIYISGGAPVAMTYSLGANVNATVPTGNQGGVSYYSAAGTLASTAAGQANQYLKSNGTSAPTWESAGSIAANETKLVNGGAVHTAINAEAAKAREEEGKLDTAIKAEAAKAREEEGKLSTAIGDLSETVNGYKDTAASNLGTHAATKAATNALGHIKASNVLTSVVELTSPNGSTADRYYGVQVDKDGIAFVNVPWTDEKDSALNPTEIAAAFTEAGW